MPTKPRFTIARLGGRISARLGGLMPDLIFGFFVGVAFTVLLSGIVIVWIVLGAPRGE